MRRFGRVFAALCAVVVVLMVCAAPAQAAVQQSIDKKCLLTPLGCFAAKVSDPRDCVGPPPAAPDRGVSSWLVRDPDPVPEAASPWADGAKTSIYEQYGTGWARWRTCDLNADWMPDATNVQSQADNSMGTWLLSVPSFLTSVYAAVITVAMDPGSWLGWLRPVLVGITDGIRDGLTTWSVRVVLLAAALILLWNARKWELHRALGVLAMVVVVGAGIALIVNDPFRWVQGGSDTTAAVVADVTTGTAQGDSSDGVSENPATQATSRVVDVVLYRPWLQGMFGTSEGATVEKYGPALLNAGSLRWSEVQEIREHPDHAKDITKDHQAAWSAIMSDLEKEDPAAYEYATGRDGANRTWAGLRALIAMLCVLPILLVGAIVILAVGPQLLWSTVHLLVVLPLAVLPSQTAAKYVLAPLMSAGAAMLNAVAMGVAMAIQLLATVILFAPSSDVPEWLALILTLLLTIFMWRATRAHRQVAAAPMRWAWKGTKAGVGLGVSAATGGWGAVAKAAAARQAAGVEPEDEKKTPENVDSAHAERTAPMLAIEAGELPEQREERLLMEAEILEAKHKLTGIPEQRQPSYEAPGGRPLTSVPGETHWTPPEPEPARRWVAGESEPEDVPSTSEPTGWPSTPVEPVPGAQPTGWPRPEQPAQAADPAMTYDDGGVQASVWTPETGDMSLEESWAAVQSPAVEVEPTTGFVPVERRSINLDGDR